MIMNESTPEAVINQVQVLELSTLNEFAILYGYIAMVITVFVLGYFAHAIINRKKK